MSNTIFIQILDNKAEQLLRNLEDLKLIKLLKFSVQNQLSLPEKYAGKLPLQVANNLEQYICQIRTEWNQRNI